MELTVTAGDRTTAADPKEPVVSIFWSTDRSTLEPVARRTCRANQSSATAVIRGSHPTIGTRSRLNDRTRKPQTFAHDPEQTAFCVLSIGICNSLNSI